MRTQKFTAISLCLAGLATAPALPAQTLDMANPPAAATAVATLIPLGLGISPIR